MRTATVQPFRNRSGAQRGALSGVGLVLLVLLGLVLVVGGCGVGKYNGMVSNDETVESAWSQVNNMYKRRYDLVPQLVETVKGAADFEKSTITEVTEARASVGKIQLPDSLPGDPAQLEAWAEAQAGLGGALTRLLAVAESYPQLRATENFRDLQTQLEGNENRIATARTDYIEAVRTYNTGIRKFPGNLVAGVFGFDAKPQLPAEEGASQRPDIDFGENG